MAQVAESLQRLESARGRSPSSSFRIVEPLQLPAAPSTLALRMQRLVDLAVASVSLVVLAVPMLLIAAAVRLSSRGPALFVHERVGRGGETFRLVKFRTMRVGTHEAVWADASEHAAYRANGYKLREDDPRITVVGRVLRRTSLDELPQFWNVLKGDMSIVGVRPLVRAELLERPDRDQELYRRFRPGMTGLWQVEGRSTVVGVERFDADLRHLEGWSFWNSIGILLRTPSAVLRVWETQ